MKTKLIKNISSLLSIHLLNYVFPLVLIPFLSHSFGESYFGYYILLEAFGSWVNLILEYGFKLSGSREIVRCSKPSGIIIVVDKIISSKIILFCIVLCFLPFLSFVLPKLFLDQNLLILLLLKVFLLSLSPVWYYLGVENMTKFAVVNVWTRILSFIAIFTSIFIVPRLSILYIIQIIFISIGLIYNYRGLIQKLNWRFRFVKPFEHLKGNYEFFILNLTGGAYSQATSLILSNFVSIEIVGFYGGIEKIIRSITSLTSPLTNAIYPYLNKIYESSSFKTFMSKFMKIKVLYLVLGCCIVIFLNLFDKFIIVNILNYSMSKVNLLVFRLFSLVPLFVSLGTVFNTLFLFILGRERLSMKIISVCSIFAIILSVILSTYFGVIGMTIALCFTEFVVFISFYIVFKKLSQNGL